METIHSMGWIFYVNDKPIFDSNKVGKWMYFFDDKNFVAEICKKAVNNHIVEEAKHSDDTAGVACFYLNCDDLDAHKRVIAYFLENNLIKKTKKGRLYNISFKFDKQTKAREYGENFHSNIKLENFINLDTGEWIS